MEKMSTAGPERVTTAELFGRLRILLRPERRDLAAAVIYAIGAALLSLAIPIAVQALVNTVAFGALIQPLVFLVVLLLAGLIFAGGMRALLGWVVELVQQRVFARVALTLSARLARVHVSAFDRARGPELVNRFFDVLTVQKSAATLLVEGVAVALQTVVGLVVLAFYHPVLLAFGFILTVCIGFILFVLGRRAAETAVAESKSKYEVASWLQDVARHPWTFKSTEGETLAQARALERTRGYVEARRVHFRIVFRQILASLALYALASAALLGIGGWLVIERQLTLGQLVAAELIVSAVLAGFTRFGKYLESLYDLLAAVDKLGHLFDLPTEREGGHLPHVGERGMRVELHDVVFRHEGGAGGVEVPSGIIEPGERVAVCMPTGSGKSTLLDLLYGLRSPSEGRIELDGMDLRLLDLPRLRSQTALVRGAAVFEGTIEENVTMGRADISPADVRASLEAVDLWRDVARLPDGLRTQVAPTGAPLSEGQAHRLTLARAIAGRPRLLLVDDLEGMSDGAEAGLLEVLGAPDRPWTLIVTRGGDSMPTGSYRTLQVNPQAGRSA